MAHDGLQEEPFGTGGTTLHFETARPGSRRVPKYAYALLFAAVLAVSSAASAFRELNASHPAPKPLTVAAWRLQATSVILAPLCAFQWKRCPPEIKLKSKQLWWLLGVSGVCLAAHFGTWVWGLDHTSIPHALLFVTSSPLIMTIAALVMRVPISRGEVLGAFGGFFGMVLLCFDTARDKEVGQDGSLLQVTIIGDVMALFGAVAIVGYLQAGSAVRGWMPIFIYALPVTAVSAVLLSLVAFLVDKLSLFAAGSTGIFGYFASSHGWWVLYLAVVPGLVGHTGFNTLLRFFSPLVISMAFPFEPLVGSVIGAALGLEKVPGVLTWLGGSMIVCALIYNTYYESRRAAVRQKKATVSQVMAGAMNDHESMEMAAFTIADTADETDFFVDQN